MTFKNLLAASAAFALLGSGSAFADAAGVGVGATTGSYSATAASSGNTGQIVAHTQQGNFSQTSGTVSSASAGMAIGARTAVETETNIGLFGGSSSTLNSSAATIEGFGTASSLTTTSYAGNGGALGFASGAAQSSGTAASAGAFGGVGIIAASE